MAKLSGTEKSDVSIYSVAEEAGVSIVSVSRVFNDYPHVSARMRERVFQAARRIGYTPKLVSKPRVIAVLVGHLGEISTGDFKSRMTLTLIEEAAQRGFLIEFIPADRLELATKKLVEGIVEYGLTSQETETLRQLPPVPSVAVNKPGPTKHWHSVRTDHFEEGKLAAEHLIHHGHRHVALVLDEAQGWSAEERLRGFESAVTKSPEPVALEVGYAESESSEGIAHRLISTGCTGCALLTDNIGYQLLSDFQNHHEKLIPGDLSVITLEHSGVSANHHPPLTTIHQPLKSLAAHIMTTLEALINDEDVDAEIILQSSLISRDSVRDIC